jgi:hypothetical protein
LLRESALGRAITRAGDGVADALRRDDARELCSSSTRIIGASRSALTGIDRAFESKIAQNNSRATSHEMFKLCGKKTCTVWAIS